MGRRQTPGTLSGIDPRTYGRPNVCHITTGLTLLGHMANGKTLDISPHFELLLFKTPLFVPVLKGQKAITNFSYFTGSK